MNTIPDISIREHLNNFLTAQKEVWPNLDAKSLRFFDAIRAFRLTQLEEEQLMGYEAFCAFFEKLCLAGHRWINLSGDSWHESLYLVSVEYSAETGGHATMVALSGPSLDINHQPLKQTRLSIIKKVS